MTEQTGFIYKASISLRASENGSQYSIEVVELPVKETRMTYKILGGGGLMSQIKKEKLREVDSILINKIGGNATLQYHIFFEYLDEVDEMKDLLVDAMTKLFMPILDTVKRMEAIMSEGLTGSLDPVRWKDNPFNPENMPKNIQL